MVTSVLLPRNLNPYRITLESTEKSDWLQVDCFFVPKIEKKNSAKMTCHHGFLPLQDLSCENQGHLMSWMSISVLTRGLSLRSTLGMLTWRHWFATRVVCVCLRVVDKIWCTQFLDKNRAELHMQSEIYGVSTNLAYVETRNIQTYPKVSGPPADVTGKPSDNSVMFSNDTLRVTVVLFPLEVKSVNING